MQSSAVVRAADSMANRVGGLGLPCTLLRRHFCRSRRYFISSAVSCARRTWCGRRARKRSRSDSKRPFNCARVASRTCLARAAFSASFWSRCVASSWDTKVLAAGALIYGMKSEKLLLQGFSVRFVRFQLRG